MDDFQLNICVLASGSKGNSTYVGTNKTSLLIDLGISCLNAEKKLKDIGVSANKIKAILITHTHVDHINGLKIFIKKYNPTIYLTKKMYQELSTIIEINNVIIIEDDFIIGDIKIEIIKTSHDVSDSNGYILTTTNSSLVYITDTGYINKKYYSKLKNKSIYILESNHDVEKLMSGSYPYHLKQRILGDKGHLSNDDCAYYLTKLVGNNTKYIILAHLSEENNDISLAYKTVNNKVGNRIEKIIVATQKERTELIKI